MTSTGISRSILSLPSKNQIRRLGVLTFILRKSSWFKRLPKNQILIKKWLVLFCTGVCRGYNDGACRFISAPSKRVLGHTVSPAELYRGIRSLPASEWVRTSLCCFLARERWTPHIQWLLSSRCVKDQTVSFLNITEGQSGRNGQKSTVRYSFDMFRFSADPHDLYLHCTVQLCDLDDHESCIPVSCCYYYYYWGRFRSVWTRWSASFLPSHHLWLFSGASFFFRIVTRSVREKQWVQTPLRVSSPMAPSGSKYQTDLSPVSSCFYINPYTVPAAPVASAGFCCPFILFKFHICFRRTVGGGAARSSCVDSRLLPHHPHHCGQG